MHTNLSVKECLSFGWKTFKRRPWIFVQVGLVLFAFGAALNIVNSALDASSTSPALLSIASLIFGIASLYLSIVINNMGALRFALKAHDDVEAASLRDLWAPHPFWKYVATMLLVSAIVIVGFILLIVPGIILSLVLGLSLYLVMDKGLGPLEAIKESARITRGSRVKLFLLTLAIIGINILGLLALVVGLFVSVSISIMAMVHAYRVLAGSAAPASPPGAS
jgi:uncharacterized membrane protein